MRDARYIMARKGSALRAEVNVEPDLNVDVDATDVEAPDKPQKVWPLFLVGLALMGLGYYFVFATGSDGVELETDAVEAREQQESFGRAPSETTPIVQPMTLELESGPRRLRYQLGQSTVRATAEGVTALETKIELTATDEPVDGEGIRYDRTYSEIDANMSEDGKAVGGKVAEQVEELIGTARHRLEYAENGRLTDYELRSSGAAQLRQLLSILTDAAAMAALQFPREPINAGEPWSYKAPYSGSGDSGVAIEGSFVMQNRLVGSVELDGRTYAVIEQDLSGTARGTFLLDEKEAPVKSQGVGRAVFYYDVQSKQIDRVEMSFEQVSSLGAAQFGLQTTNLIEITAEDFPPDE